jgi:hypothetical protein
MSVIPGNHSDSDPRSSGEIFASLVSKWDEKESEGYRDNMRTLQYRFDEALFEEMRQFLSGADEARRFVAVDVLRQSFLAKKARSEECVDMLLAALPKEQSPRVLALICHAFRHHRAAAAVNALARFQNHPDADIRLGVANGLTCQDDPLAISTLIALSADPDRDVRNWATFGLGSMTAVDSPAIREALFARLTGEDYEVAGEALVGLALRGDVRVAQPLLEAMNSSLQSGEDNGWAEMDAAEAARTGARKNPNDAWRALLARCDELGLAMPGK